jgi:hypothetical protein
MSDLLAKWLTHYDPIHRGWTPAGIANGVCATRGFAFPRVAGGYNLYRATEDDPAFSAAEIVGAAGARTTKIATFDWRPAAADSAYRFAIRSIGGGGVESPVGTPQCLVTFDDAGSPTGGTRKPVGAPSMRAKGESGVDAKLPPSSILFVERVQEM